MKAGKVKKGEGISLNAGEMMKDYCKRIRQTRESSLNARNKVKRTNSWSVSALQYFFMAMGWSGRVLLNLDRRTRETMRKNKCHYRNAFTTKTISLKR